jgi:copper resistance protein D
MGTGSSPRLRPNPALFAGFVRSATVFTVLLVAISVSGVLVAETLAGSTQLPGLPAPSIAVTYGIVVCRLLMDLSIVATMGLGLVSKFLGFDEPDSTEPVMTRARRIARVTSWTWVVTALGSIVLLSAEVFPDAFPRRSSGLLDVLTLPLSFLQYLVTEPNLVWDFIGRVPAGKGLLICAGFGLFSVWLCHLAVRKGESVPAEVRAGVPAFGLLPLPLTGHASPWKYHDLMMISMEGHVIAAAAWVGGLGCCILLLARRPTLLALALPRFSRLATWCVFVVAASGTFSAIAMLATTGDGVMPEAIWTTRYGLLALTKLAIIVLMGVIAVVVRRGMLVRIVDRKPTAIALWCGFELTLMMLAYGVAVVLTRSAPF